MVTSPLSSASGPSTESTSARTAPMTYELGCDGRHSSRATSSGCSAAEWARAALMYPSRAMSESTRLRRARARIVSRRGEHGALRQREVLHARAEQVAARRLHSIRPVSQVDHVEIQLENLVLVEIV